MSRRTCTMMVDVEYDDRVTDPESLATAMDRLLETALSTPGILDDYGEVRVNDFVLHLPSSVDLQMDESQLSDKNKTLMRVAINYEDGRRAFGFLSAKLVKSGVAFELTVKRRDGETHTDVNRSAVAHPREQRREKGNEIWLS